VSNITKTYSGDFSSFIAGKLLNAAGMAKGESDRRETENLEKARPGSLFAKALQSEFGGDLYNRTLGNLDPRKSAAETNRKSNKEARYRAQFDDLKKTPKSDLDGAERELLKEDDSIPVKDTDTRRGVSKLLGRGLDEKISLADSRVRELSSDVASVKNTLIDTQKLIFDQNEMLGARFDQILEIFSAQQDYQKKIADESEVKRRENELEAEKDLSTTRKLQSITDSKSKKSDVLGDILGVAADMLRGRGGAALRKFLDSLRGKKGTVGSVLRAVSGLAQRGFGASLDARAFKRYKELRYSTKRKDTLAEALGQTARRSPGAKILDDLIGRPPMSSIDEGVTATRKASDAQSLFNELTRQGGKFEDEILGVDDLPRFLKKNGIPDEVFDDLIADGMDPKEVARLRSSAENLRASGKAKKVTSTMGREVTEELSSRAGASALSKSGKTAATKGLGKAGKFIPGIGTGIAVAEAAYRFSQKDTVGGLMSLGSAIPILGWGFTAFDIARDLGFDPLNTLPQQKYEQGTELTKPGTAILHGTEAILGSKDREDMMKSYQQSIDSVGSTLVSAAVSLADSAGQGQAVKSELKKSGLSFDIVRMPISSKIGKTGQLSILSSLENDFKREIFPKSEDEEKKSEDDDESPTSGPPAPLNTVVPEYDLEYNAPNSAVKMTSGNTVTYYKTNDLGGLDSEITEEEAKRIIARNSRPATTASDPGRNGSYASGTWIGPAGDRDGEQTGLNMNLPGGIGTPIYAPVDLIYRSKGTDGNPSVGLQGTADALGPSGSGFGYYGSYYFEKDGKEYEVLMGHFRDLPYRGSSEGQVIPKGTLIGYQGASGRSVSADNGIYPHISLHVNGIGFNADNGVLRWFADGLASGTAPTSSGGGGGGGHRSIALHELSKDEALSSLTPGVNDYIKPGGRSVVSNQRWGDITDDTLIYPYLDSVGQPTIGYGSAGMRGVTMRTKPITVRQAKQILRKDIDRIELGLSKNIKHWKSMSDQQKAALIMFEYNAGMGNAYGGYRQLSAALEQGNMRQAADELLRGGPAPTRIETEQRLLLSGPQQIVGPKKVGRGIVGEGRVGAGIPLLPDLTIKNFFDALGGAIKKGVDDGLNRSNETFNEGLIPTKNNRVNQLQSNSSLLEDMEEDSMVQQIYIINNVVASNSDSPVISSRGGSSINYVDQYRMAVLGA